MSLDVCLTNTKPGGCGSGIFVRRNGQTVEITRKEWDHSFPDSEPVIATFNAEVWSANITHNLNDMAREAGIYKALWRPEEIGITHARELIHPLTCGLAALKLDPDRFRKFNPENGWGNYETLVNFVDGYLTACVENPDAEVHADR